MKRSNFVYFGLIASSAFCLSAQSWAGYAHLNSNGNAVSITDPAPGETLDNSGVRFESSTPIKRTVLKYNPISGAPIGLEKVDIPTEIQVAAKGKNSSDTRAFSEAVLGCFLSREQAFTPSVKRGEVDSAGQLSSQGVASNKLSPMQLSTFWSHISKIKVLAHVPKSDEYSEIRPEQPEPVSAHDGWFTKTGKHIRDFFGSVDDSVSGKKKQQEANVVVSQDANGKLVLQVEYLLDSRDKNRHCTRGVFAPKRQADGEYRDVDLAFLDISGKIRDRESRAQESQPVETGNKLLDDLANGGGDWADSILKQSQAGQSSPLQQCEMNCDKATNRVTSGVADPAALAVQPASKAPAAGVIAQ